MPMRPKKKVMMKRKMGKNEECELVVEVDGEKVKGS